MYVVTGDETGLMRLINTSGQDYVTYGEQQSRSLGILSMAWIQYDVKFALLRANGNIETYKISEKDNHCIDLELIGCFASELNDPMKILKYNNCSVLCYNAKGEVNVVEISSDSDYLDLSSKLFYNDSCLRGPVGVLRYNEKNSVLVCGGEKNDLQVWNTLTKQLVWKAKNVPHDEVRLEVPVWITDIAFMPTIIGDEDSPVECSGNLIATGTAHKHIRMYDIRVQRQPCQSWNTGDFRVTNIAPSYHHDKHLYVADCAGGLLLYDMRNGRRLRTLNGFDGSVRDLCLDGLSELYMAAVSLDRYVKIYDCKKNEQIFQAYLKNRLNCNLVFGDPFSDVSKSDTENTPSDSEGEDIVEDFLDSSDEESDEESSDDRCPFPDIENFDKKHSQNSRNDKKRKRR